MISNMAQVFFLFIWLFIKFMRYSSYLIYHSNTTMHMFYWQERLLFVKQIPLDPISYMINPLSYKINLTFIRQFPMWLGPSITRSVLNFVTCLWMNIWKVFVCSPKRQDVCMILKSDSGLFDVLVGKSQDLWGEKIK